MRVNHGCTNITLQNIPAVVAALVNDVDLLHPILADVRQPKCTGARIERIPPGCADRVPGSPGISLLCLQTACLWEYHGAARHWRDRHRCAAAGPAANRDSGRDPAGHWRRHHRPYRCRGSHPGRRQAGRRCNCHTAGRQHGLALRIGALGQSTPCNPRRTCRCRDSAGGRQCQAIPSRRRFPPGRGYPETAPPVGF